MRLCPVTIARDKTVSHHYDGGVARWQPNPRERLERSALALFAEQGYEDTTVEQIAAGAGLARSTFFRHFRDKREILFGGQDGLAVRLADSIENAPPGRTPLEAVEAAFTDIAQVSFTPERRDMAPQRLAVVASNPELRERELLKRGGIITAITTALHSRGVTEPAATVAAELAALAFSRAIATWAAPDNTDPFDTIAHDTLRALHAAATELR